MKTTNDYLTNIRQFKQQFAEKYGIISIGIFGSVARGEQHEESDLDVFVELKDPARAFPLEAWQCGGRRYGVCRRAGPSDRLHRSGSG